MVSERYRLITPYLSDVEKRVDLPLEPMSEPPFSCPEPTLEPIHDTILSIKTTSSYASNMQSPC